MSGGLATLRQHPGTPLLSEELSLRRAPKAATAAERAETAHRQLLQRSCHFCGSDTTVNLSSTPRTASPGGCRSQQDMFGSYAIAYRHVLISIALALVQAQHVPAAYSGLRMVDVYSKCLFREDDLLRNTATLQFESRGQWRSSRCPSTKVLARQLRLAVLHSGGCSWQLAAGQARTCAQRT